MPPTAQGPPAAVVVKENNGTSPVGRKSHIEVCVRIRPLTVTKESSTSFFEKTKGKSASLRKPQLPTPRKPPRSRLFGRSPRNASPSAAQKSQVDDTHLLENGGNDAIYAWDVVSEDTVNQSPQTDIIPGRTHTYTLDRVYGPEVSTPHLYKNSVQGLVHAAMEGYHTSVLAYGQTSTGKTHTMSGTSSQPGIIPMAVRECFECVGRQNDSPREYLLRVSYLEVYKEQIRDLLASEKYALPVRLFDSADGLVIKGLREEVVTSPEGVFKLLAEGESRRQIGVTHMNAHSSRSHVIVRLWIESRAVVNKRLSGGASPPQSTSSSISSDHRGGAVRVSSFSLVDLAGSESVRLTGNTDRRNEGHYINKSLMTLGQVVYALSESMISPDGFQSKKHVPYRDSKLTRLLQPSLSGNAQVLLLCCISPMATHIEESHNTFKFATRAKKIPQKATIQESNDEKTLLQSYREEIEDLKKQLKDAKVEKDKASTATSVAPTTEGVFEDEIEQLADAIQTMEKLILKNKPLSPMQRPEDLLDSSDGDDSDDDEGNLLALVNESNTVLTPAKTPSRTTKQDRDLHAELNRVQGLLGSVLQRRKNGGIRTVGKSSDHEVRNLRAQLEKQEVATSLRQADSSFLQIQLEEKDNLLQEVSKVLEALDERQTQLEAENAALRKEVADLRAEADLNDLMDF